MPNGVATVFPTFVGQRVLIECIYRLNGVPTDPTIVLATSQAPDGTTVTLTYPDANLTRRDTGIYEAVFLVDQPGTWIFRGDGAGVVDAVNETLLQVTASGITN